MSLQALFADRKIRKSITESVMNGIELGIGECDSCGNNDTLIQVKNHNICERCCRKVMESMNDYEASFSDVNEDTLFRDIIHETYISIDQNKFKAEAKNKFGDDSRDSLMKLIQSYGMKAHKDFDDRWDKGRLYVVDGDISSGKTRINQFMIDFDCKFLSSNAAQKLVPDADGTIAPVGTNVPSNGSQPASVTNTSTKSSSKTNTPIQAGPGLKAEGSDVEFDVKLTDDAILHVRLENGTHKMQINDGKPVNIVFLSKGKEAMMEEAMSLVKKRPHEFFKAVDEEDFQEGYTVEKYEAYSFLFDDKSFDGKNISLALALQGKPYENSRVYITYKDLNSRASLNKTLQEYVDDRMKKIYPCLYDGTADVKTSVGKAVTYLVAVIPSTKDKLGEIQLKTEVGNIEIKWSSSGSRFQDKESTKNSVYDTIYQSMDKIIPSWSNPKFRTKAYKGSLTSVPTDGFAVETINPDMTVYAIFDLNDMYDTGNIIFNISVIDTQSGIEQPKEYEKVVYRKAGVSLENFLSKEGRVIHKEYFDKSDMTQTLKVSAQEKMKSPSKKAAFLEKVKYNLLKGLNRINVNLRKDLEMLEIDFDEFNVNKEGKVTSIIMRISDPNELVSVDARTLGNHLDLEKKLNWVKFQKADNSPRALANYGPSMVYKITNIERFAEVSSLAILESLMLEAFDITTVNESGRKQIFA